MRSAVRSSTLGVGVPVLPTLAIEEAIDFYERKLGFTRMAYFEADSYALLQRDSVEIHLWGCNDPHVVEHSGCYIRVKGIEDLFEEFRSNGVKVVVPLELKSYGVKEFAIQDFDGNLLRFGEAA